MPLDLNDPETKQAVESIVAEQTEGLVAKNNELLSEVKKFKTKAKTVEGFDVEDYKRLKSAEDEIEVKKAEAEGNYKELLDKQTNKFTSEIDSLKEQLSGEQSFTRNLLVDNAMTDKLLEAGVAKPLIPAAKALLMQNEMDIVTEGDKRSAVVKTDDGELGIADFVNKWTQGEQGSHFLAAPANGGGGTTPSSKSSGVSNPWKTESRNLTEQARIKKENPELASKLKSEAGV